MQLAARKSALLGEPVELVEPEHEPRGEHGLLVDHHQADLLEAEPDEVVEVGHEGQEAGRALPVEAQALHRSVDDELGERVREGAESVLRGGRVVEGRREGAERDVVQRADGKPTSDASVRSSP